MLNHLIPTTSKMYYNKVSRMGRYKSELDQMVIVMQLALLYPNIMIYIYKKYIYFKLLQNRKKCAIFKNLK